MHYYDSFYIQSGNVVCCTGTRLQDEWNENSKENVATKYEDQVDRFGDFDSFDPYHSAFSLPWLQLWWKMKTEIFWHHHILRAREVIYMIWLYVCSKRETKSSISVLLKFKFKRE